MNKIFEFTQGTLPILVSMPHNGFAIPEDIAANMTESARESKDTDWFMDRVYQFSVEMGCSLIKPEYSRYVIDLNRPDDNQSLYPGANTTELCPTTQFDNRPIYQVEKEPSANEIFRRIEIYWRPYHQKLQQSLAEMKQKFGYALLFEAHSIKSMVPRFFDGQLPDFNFGNFNEKSSGAELTKIINNWLPDGYSKVFNDRFKGGYITRHYGKPNNQIDSLQLELSQATYLNEQNLAYDTEKAKQVINVIKGLFSQLEIFSLKNSKKS